MSVEQDERAKLSLNFDEDDVIVENRKEIDQKVREISERAGFVSKSPISRSSVVSRARRTRAKTGRTYPFNTKIKPETYDMICYLSDTASEEEGRPVSLAEIIERAVGQYCTAK
nr:hypothetical protein [Cytophagales bacterium]